MTGAPAGLGRQARRHRIVDDVSTSTTAPGQRVRELHGQRVVILGGTSGIGALGAVHAAAPHLRPGGSITWTTGLAGRRPGPGWAVAASICGAVESLARWPSNWHPSASTPSALA